MNLPVLERAVLRSFTLYDREPEIVAHFDGGVFCLAGANGLGKSTFLSAVNFGLTGVVAEPDRKFASADEYLEDCRAYSAKAFRGRISIDDKDESQIELVFVVGDRRYRIARNMFEPTELRLLEVSPVADAADTSIEVLSNALDETGSARHLKYEQSIVADVGVHTFAQFAMLQHLVLTFDERRHLIFWDKDLLESSLFLAFGLDPDKARRADELRRKAERQESLARNQRYASLTAKRMMADLESKADTLDDEFDQGRQELTRYYAERDELHDRFERARDAHKDADIQRTEVASKLQLARAEYSREFDSAVFGRKDPRVHPIVRSLESNAKCPMCGSVDDDVAAHVHSALDRGCCPICLDRVNEQSEQPSTALAEIDSRVKALDSEYASKVQLAKLLFEELESAQNDLHEKNRAIDEFVRGNESVLYSADVGSAETIQRILLEKQSEIATRDSAVDAHRRERDRCRQELRKLQDELVIEYRAVEQEFGTLFSSLAEEFLGLDVHVDFEFGAGSIRLVLSVNDDERRTFDALSESQRFFIDIALRMALSIQLTGGSSSTLYIDTPEGSLDIAYERRAGEMFGVFVEHYGCNLVMTANINTSELLVRLAERCGAPNMSLQRMTAWASLSKVQSKELKAFDQAFADVERHLV